MDTLNKYLTFTLGPQVFAIPIESVREVQDAVETTRIPQTPPFMLGVMNLRGTAVPVVDLKRKFGMGPTQRTINSRIAIVEGRKGDDDGLVGALADSVREVLEIDPSVIEEAPRMGMRVKPDFIRGVARSGEAFVVLLDIARIFSAEEMVFEPGPEMTAESGQEPS
ncbi:MAG: chemotaxis protein CheW [Deltaproteobacteria bacterium]|nr:chemotaxis protein CheW [Deltaproteobacteria bacterium]